MSMAVIVGLGSYGLDVPLMVVPSVEAGENFILSLGIPRCSHDPHMFSVYNFVFGTGGVTGQPSASEWQMKRMRENLFREDVTYPNGVGCNALRVVQSHFYQPLVGWSLSDKQSISGEAVIPEHKATAFSTVGSLAQRQLVTPPSQLEMVTLTDRAMSSAMPRAKIEALAYLRVKPGEFVND